MIRKALLLKLFDAAYMQRWNDKLRPVELTELDKQAHKMVIAYFLGKFEEEKGRDVNWIDVVEGGIFELLQRIVLTDLKPPVFYKIRADAAKYAQLNEWVHKQLEPFISPLDGGFCKRFREYFADSSETLTKRVLSAAHFYATKWEFDIVQRANPQGYEIARIENDLQDRQEEYYDLAGIAQLAMRSRYRHFIDLCGQLRFQIRWAHLYRIPRTSVLGHSLFVAILSYLFSREGNSCDQRCVNNYFTGLFHDLPEVLTRDIISPVKRSVEELEDLIKDYEREVMQEIYDLIPDAWHPQIRTFTENEFDSIVTVDGKTKKVSSEEISSSYNEDSFNPRDGEFVKAADSLAAFIEAYEGVKNGSASEDLQKAILTFKESYRNKTIAGVNLGEIYADFD